jgi:hypothetical protein
MVTYNWTSLVLVPPIGTFTVPQRMVSPSVRPGAGKHSVGSNEASADAAVLVVASTVDVGESVVGVGAVVAADESDVDEEPLLHAVSPRATTRGMMRDRFIRAM